MEAWCPLAVKEPMHVTWNSSSAPRLQLSTALSCLSCSHPQLCLQNLPRCHPKQSCPYSIHQSVTLQHPVLAQLQPAQLPKRRDTTSSNMSLGMGPAAQQWMMDPEMETQMQVTRIPRQDQCKLWMCKVILHTNMMYSRTNITRTVQHHHGLCNSSIRCLYNHGCTISSIMDWIVIMY